MIRTVLFTAALAAAAAPALAADLKTDGVCEKRVAANSWHECGAAPGTGTITYINAGTHEVTVFTTGPEDIDADAGPFIGPICRDGGYAGDEILECQVNRGRSRAARRRSSPC
jgi:hypothetical protein